jgi:hypothetical protein
VNFFKFIDDLIASVWEATKEGDSDVLIQNGAIFAGQHVAEKFKVLSEMVSRLICCLDTIVDCFYYALE